MCGRAMVEVGAQIVTSDGLAQVLSGLTSGPDKVRFKKNSQIRYTWLKIGLERGSGFWSRDALLRMAISRQKHDFLRFFFRGQGVNEPPN